MTTFQLGDFGIPIRVRAVDPSGQPIPLATATSLVFEFTTPTTTFTRTAPLLSDGSDGRCAYTLADGDLNARGLWLVRLHAVFPLEDWRTRPGSFYVA